MGPDYIEIALRKAREVTPKTKLYLVRPILLIANRANQASKNDYNIEGINVKSNAMYNLAVGLTKKGLLDGIGLEVRHDLLRNRIHELNIYSPEPFHSERAPSRYPGKYGTLCCIGLGRSCNGA